MKELKFDKLNLTMLCDFYELTMGHGYFRCGNKDRITYFDVFYRRVPDNGGFAIAAGLEQVVHYIENLHYTEEDIEYLRSRNLFSEDFPGLSSPFPLHRRHLGGSRGNARIPQ